MPATDRLALQLAFVLELERLKTVRRRTLLTDRSRHETSAEHSWHFALMAVGPLRPHHPGRRLRLGRHRRAPEANSLPMPKPLSANVFEAASCIGCDACVAQCPNGVAHLFTAAKIAHLGLLPQGQPERDLRVVAMVEQMEGRGLRLRLQPPRVRGHLPQGHLDRLDCPHEPRLHAGQAARGGAGTVEA